MSNKYAVKCTKCDYTTVVNMVSDDFDYDKWIVDTKKRYTNERIKIQIPIAASISQECQVDPNDILGHLMREFWAHWDWETHIRVVEQRKEFSKCKGCQDQLELPMVA